MTASGDRRAAVIGAGAWGTTLANVLAENGASVSLWCRRDELAAALARDRENRAYLPGIRLHDAVRPTADLGEAVPGRGLVVAAVPSHAARGVADRAARHLAAAALVVSAAKGIENASLCRMSDVLAQSLGVPERIGVLSGPSFAREVSEGRPTAVTLAAPDEGTARAAREWLGRPHLRIYTSSDVVGVELGGALKNVIAVAAGLAEGLGAGLNGRAALITRGMAEIHRLGEPLGAQPLTLAGLAGMGDLILTCTSSLSRNYRVGLRLARGERLGGGAVPRGGPDGAAPAGPGEGPPGGSGEVAEGIRTSRSAFDLARREEVEMPIVNEVYAILHQAKSPRAALEALMSREAKAEFWR
jgi:glycerol-3-phosphate dehydrogenase (NAD(P)+)